jgi:hypothetical protein
MRTNLARERLDRKSLGGIVAPESLIRRIHVTRWIPPSSRQCLPPQKARACEATIRNPSR